MSTTLPWEREVWGMIAKAVGAQLARRAAPWQPGVAVGDGAFLMTGLKCTRR